MKSTGNKPEIMRVLLIAVFVMTGYLLFVQPLQQRGTPKSHPELLTELQKLNREIKDQSAKRVFTDYEKALGADASLSTAERDEKWLAGHILLADTEYKAAKQRNDIARVTPAADNLTNLQRRFGTQPIWTKPVQVASHPDFPRTEVSPAQMKEDVRALSSELGKVVVWGWFPGYQLIDAIVRATGAAPWFSFALACFLLAVLVRTIVFPFSHKQMMWGRQMSQLSPLMNEIREKYKSKDGKPMTLEQQNQMNQETMSLYQEYGINPVSGCLPMVIQLPIFLVIYQSMLHYRFEFEKGFFLWINPQVGAMTNGFLGANLGQKDYLLILLYSISMVVTTLLTPVSDPQNAKQSRLMMIGISVLMGVVMFFWPVPSAFVLYWTFTNILATAQSLWAYRLPLSPLTKKNTKTGGVYPNGHVNGAVSATLPSGPRKTGVPQRHKPKKKK